MADKKIYWHLPGFCYFRLLNQVLMNLMKDYPDCFEEKYCIGSVYGTFPGAVWNGGRAVFGITGNVLPFLDNWEYNRHLPVSRTYLSV